MNREDAIELARRHAKANPRSYYSEPFSPHEWVVSAILEAGWCLHCSASRLVVLKAKGSRRSVCGDSGRWRHAVSGVTKEWLDRELASRGKTGLAEKFGLSVGNFNALIKVMEMKDDKDDPDVFDRIVASALRQSVLQFERIEKLEDDLKQANNIIRYLDDVIEWRPIETAPDCTTVLVSWCDDDGYHVMFDALLDGVWNDHEEGVEHFHCVAPAGSQGPPTACPYTHWMPLPEPPKVGVLGP